MPPGVIDGSVAFGYTGAIAAGHPQPGLALPGMPTDLALPGMGRGNGHGHGNGNGRGMGGVQVKQEDDPLRLRGGAVRIFHSLRLS